jgi:hypothetical protein
MWYVQTIVIIDCPPPSYTLTIDDTLHSTVTPSMAVQQWADIQYRHYYEHLVLIEPNHPDMFHVAYRNDWNVGCYPEAIARLAYAHGPGAGDYRCYHFRRLDEPRTLMANWRMETEAYEETQDEEGIDGRGDATP